VYDVGYETAIGSAGSGSRRAVRSVLVVDDSASQRFTLSRMLRRSGYRVAEAGSGRAALRACATDPPDLVLSDWMMPEMDGLAFCREFRRMTRDSYGYFILLTSKGAKEDITRGFDAGADDFLTKPVNAAELRARISACERVLRMEAQLTEKTRLVESTLDELRQVHEAIDSDLIEARKLQQSLVSERYRDFTTAEVSLLLRSAGRVGGDLVGFYPIGKRRLGVYGIDVSGHGISSAMLTARLSGLLSSSVPGQNVALKRLSGGTYVPRPPAEVVGELNQLFLQELRTELYFTLLLCDVDLTSGRVCMVQAGHPHPILLRVDGRSETVGAGGLPVGLLDGASYEQTTFHLRPGDRLLIHSDGLTECADPQGDQLGDAGLMAMARALAGLPPARMLDALLTEVFDFAGGMLDDDASAALLSFRPTGKSAG